MKKNHPLVGANIQKSFVAKRKNAIIEQHFGKVFHLHCCSHLMK
jgi:hypothetical protein